MKHLLIKNTFIISFFYTLGILSQVVMAQDLGTRIAFVNLERILSESKMARMPEPKGREPVALLAEEKRGYLYFGIGHAR